MSGYSFICCDQACLQQSQSYVGLLQRQEALFNMCRHPASTTIFEEARGDVVYG
jgi:hypothetical protein